MDENGPAHKKTFFVMLKLGINPNTSSTSQQASTTSDSTTNELNKEETYTANGTSIKKAQHAAAELALKNTKYKKPTSRSVRNTNSLSSETSDNNPTDSTKLDTDNQNQDTTLSINPLQSRKFNGKSPNKASNNRNYLFIYIILVLLNL